VVQKGTTVIYGVRPDDKLAKILLERMGPLPRTFSGTRTFAFTSDRKKLLVIPLDQKVSPLKLVDLATWAVQEIALPPELGNITEAVFSPDANRLAVTDTDTPVEPAVTSVYDLTQKKIIRQVKLTKEQKAASATRFSPDGRQLWRGFCAWEIDGSGDECTVLMETKDRPLFLSQDGKLGFVLSGTGSSTACQVWDTARKSQVLSIPLSGVEVRGFSADTTLLALTRGQYAEIWSIREARPLVRLKMPEGCGNTNTNLAFTPDGSRIALSCRSDLWLVDWRSGAVVQEFVGHTDRLGLGFGLGEGSKVVLIARELSGFMKAWDVQP
jgi:WD40 repeat protein